MPPFPDIEVFFKVPNLSGHKTHFKMHFLQKPEISSKQDTVVIPDHHFYKSSNLEGKCWNNVIRKWKINSSSM